MAIDVFNDKMQPKHNLSLHPLIQRETYSGNIPLAWPRKPMDDCVMYLPLGICTLRDWEPTDLDSLVRNANNRAVSCHMRDRFPNPYTPADGERFLSMCMHMSPRTFLAIVVDDQAAGGVGIHLQEDVERVSAELGYWLGEPFWSRGIATAAVQAITEWAFATFPLTRLYAVPFAANLASARVLEKAGYTLEGRMRRSAIKDGQIIDQLLYACVR